MNIMHWIKNTVKKLHYSENPRYEAELLLCYVLQCTRSFIMMFDQIKISEEQYMILNDCVYRRSLGEPIAYITQETEFWSLSLRVSYDTLIPRSDTEVLIEKILLKIKKKFFLSVLDLGTGCGAIALVLAHHNPYWKIFGVDNSRSALKIAQINANRLNLKNVSFFFSNWFSNVHHKFHIIVSNPPYISKKDIKFLKKDIFFEPYHALISDKNGLSDIEKIIKQSSFYLHPKGWLFIEHGWNQAYHVKQLFKKYNFFNIQSYKDYGGNDRVTIGKKK